MAARKGFTLIEILIVLVIVGLVAAMTLPNLISGSEQTNAQMARNNLFAISAAQQKYFEDWSSYCTSTSGVDSQPTPPFCGDTTVDLTVNLHLSLSATPSFSSNVFNYSCTAVTPTQLPYTCTAGDGSDTLTLTVTAASGAVVTCANAAHPGYCPPS